MMDPELVAIMKEIDERGGALLEEFAALRGQEFASIMSDLEALRDSQDKVLEHFAAVREAQNVFSEEEEDGEA